MVRRARVRTRQILANRYVRFLLKLAIAGFFLAMMWFKTNLSDVGLLGLGALAVIILFRDTRGIVADLVSRARGNGGIK